MELTVSKAQFLDEKIHSELLSFSPLPQILGPLMICLPTRNYWKIIKKSTGRPACGLLIRMEPIRTQGMNKNFADKKELFTEALQGNEGITDVFLGELGRRQIMFQIPIYRDGKVVGGLYEAYPVELLQNAYHGSTYNDAGYSYVVDDNGSIVLAPVRFSYLQIYSTIQDVLKDGENDEESIRKFSAALRSQASGTAVFDFEGEKQFYLYASYAEAKLVLCIGYSPEHGGKDGTAIIMHTMKMAFIITAAIVFSVAVIAAFFLLRNKKEGTTNGNVQNINEAIAQNIDTAIFIVDGHTWPGRVCI